MCRERRTSRHWSRCGGVRGVWVGECAERGVRQGTGAGVGV